MIGYQLWLKDQHHRMIYTLQRGGRAMFIHNQRLAILSKVIPPRCFFHLIYNLSITFLKLPVDVNWLVYATSYFIRGGTRHKNKGWHQPTRHHESSKVIVLNSQHRYNMSLSYLCLLASPIALGSDKLKIQDREWSALVHTNANSPSLPIPWGWPKTLQWTNKITAH